MKEIREPGETKELNGERLTRRSSSVWRSRGRASFLNNGQGMELSAYWKIIRRWWWLVLLPVLAAGAAAIVTYRPIPTVYTTSVRFTAGQPSSAPDDNPGYDPNYYSWLTSEYIVTGLAGWVKTGTFAAAVSQALSGRGVELPPGAVQGALVADQSRSLLVVYATWPNSGELRSLIESAAEVLRTRSADVFPQFGGQPPEIVPLDDPSTVSLGSVGPGLRSLLDIPIKAGLGLAAGLALAFAAHALDPTIRQIEEIQKMGLTVVGQIPRVVRKKPENR